MVAPLQRHSCVVSSSSQYRQAFGCVGSVTNGGVRDLADVEAIGFRLFAQHAIVSHAYCHIVEFGKPVTVGGLSVSSGDLLHGDMHGVHQIPLKIAQELPAAARKKLTGEFDFIDFYRSPDFTVEQWRQRWRRSFDIIQAPDVAGSLGRGVGGAPRRPN
ncbi:MAG: hypothetical protein GY953_25605 [bacterium]|nr:hypothetical protein [bacterium]